MASRPKLRDRFHNCPPGWATLALGGLVLSACAPQTITPRQPSAALTEPPTTPTEASASTSRPSASPEEPRRLEGWLSIVWNDEPHFHLALDNGRTVQLLIDPELTAPLGGPLALDRTRVTVQAVMAQESPHVYEVLSITRQGDE